MSKTLEQRLLDAKAELGKVSTGISRHSGMIPADVASQFQDLVAFGGDVEHWLDIMRARGAARKLLDGLETQADANDMVPLGLQRTKFQYVRLIGVQAYLATNWALADRLVGMVGRILCTAEAGFNASQPAQLVTQFVQKERKKATAAALYESVRQTFGWPIGISYALRNHFVHDGGQLNGVDFFDGPTASAGFSVSAPGWMRIETRAAEYGVSPVHHRAAASWPTAPKADLRVTLDACERETDDALGVLVGSACKSLVAHVGYIVGED